MRKRIWVVIGQFNDGKWDIADFTHIQYAATNFREAHELKREILVQVRDNRSGYWSEEKLKVVEFKSVGKI